MKKLPPIPQEFFDANRKRFDAEYTTKEIAIEKCKHHFTRVTATEVKCALCHVGLIDMGFFRIKDGKLTT